MRNYNLGNTIKDTCILNSSSCQPEVNEGSNISKSLIVIHDFMTVYLSQNLIFFHTTEDMFDKNSYSGMFSIKTLLGTCKSGMILSSFYRHNDSAFWIGIRGAIITTVNIMGTLTGQFPCRILLFKDVIIMNSSRIAFPCQKSISFVSSWQVFVSAVLWHRL